jgi:hypothetical protein
MGRFRRQLAFRVNLGFASSPAPAENTAFR